MLHYSCSRGTPCKAECWGRGTEFSWNLLYPFQWIPWRRWGLRRKSMCPCHSTLAAWAASFPGEIQHKAAEEEKASPVTASWGFYTTLAKGGHGRGRKTERFPQIPSDLLKNGIQRYSALMEMCPCPLLHSDPAARDAPLSIPQIPRGQVTAASLSKVLRKLPAPFQCVHEDSHPRKGQISAGCTCQCPALGRAEVEGAALLPMSCCPSKGMCARACSAWLLSVPAECLCCCAHQTIPSQLCSATVHPFTNTLFQAPAVTFLPQCPPRVI